jgi:hypothetical protein
LQFYNAQKALALRVLGENSPLVKHASSAPKQLDLYAARRSFPPFIFQHLGKPTIKMHFLQCHGEATWHGKHAENQRDINLFLRSPSLGESINSLFFVLSISGLVSIFCLHHDVMTTKGIINCRVHLLLVLFYYFGELIAAAPTLSTYSAVALRSFATRSLIVKILNYRRQRAPETQLDEKRCSAHAYLANQLDNRTTFSYSIPPLLLLLKSTRCTIPLTVIIATKMRRHLLLNSTPIASH